ALDQIAQYLPGTSITLSILRHGTSMTVRVKLGSAADPGYDSPNQGTPGFLGVELPTNGPPIIDSVLAGSPAASALAPFEVITSIDGQPVNSNADVHGVLLGYGVGAKVAIGFTFVDGRPGKATVTLANPPS